MSNHYGHYGQCDHSPMSGRKSPNYLRPANAPTPLPESGLYIYIIYIYINLLDSATSFQPFEPSQGC